MLIVYKAGLAGMKREGADSNRHQLPTPLSLHLPRFFFSALFPTFSGQTTSSPRLQGLTHPNQAVKSSNDTLSQLGHPDALSRAEVRSLLHDPCRVLKGTPGLDSGSQFDSVKSA